MEEKHFVLVHGLCHGAWCWYKVATALKSAGHKVSALDMAGCGINPKQACEVRSFLEYVEPLMVFMASLPPEERVILVGHSLGGVSISYAMERFPQNISVAVFLTALMPGPDISFSSLIDEFFKSRNSRSQMDEQFQSDQSPDNHSTSLLGPNYMAAMYYLSPPEDLTLGLSLLRPSPLYGHHIAEDSKLTEENYGSVCRVYIVCVGDTTISEDKQRWMIEKNPPTCVKVILGSDHMPMFSEALQVSSTLQQIANTCSPKPFVPKCLMVFGCPSQTQNPMNYNVKKYSILIDQAKTSLLMTS